MPRDDAHKAPLLTQRGFVFSVTSTIIGNLSVTAFARKRGIGKRYRTVFARFWLLFKRAETLRLPD
ncbi:hypothetical protein KC131_00960 [Pseudomonas sp. JQ170]|uniref:hypothetical protein n=1 Tax=unclassified Pseudomonas TaxID=196821 RepID=UPI00264A8B70|nr:MULTISPECIES: hypothetical protein [unclassified Pseudomonas]MDN7139197.1 hypothetical protein [Pseudomonas sp. JQ170]WRO77481.1 hypothetical protein U9R80_07305 [Pseudomonas sp. 170C]